MTPSEIIDPVGARAQAASPAPIPEKRRRTGRHPVLGTLLILIVGFGLMHLIFVGGPQRGPLLPVAPPIPAVSVAAETHQTPGPAKRAHTQPYDVTVTGTVTAAPGASVGHPLPPQRPRGI